jgi:hypothetical protein
MKWRTSAIYLLVLLLIGGYFYYFEVVKKEQKEAAEQEAKRALPINFEDIKAIEIYAGEAKPIRIEKQDKWRITEPLNTDVDRAAFDSFFSALKNLEQERKLEGAQGNLGAFGLNNPSLKIRVQTGDQWTEILMGEKNPTGESRYSKTSTAGDIFLVAQRNWDSLDKSLKDLRKKDLFSWQTDQVVAMDVAWQNGEKIRVERQEGTKEWKAAGLPDLKIKTSKVEDLLDQLHWLRAVDFLEENAAPDPPLVEVNLQLKNGQTAEVKFGNPDTNTRQTVAVVGGNPVPVKVASFFMKDMPKSADFLADRSLIPGEPDAVSRVKWKMEGSEGNVVKIDENTWGNKPGDAKPKPLEDSHPIKALLGDLGSIEYTEAIDPPPDFPADPPNSIEFWGGDKKLSSMAWTKLSAAQGEAAVVRIEKNGETRSVKLDHESTERIKNSMDNLVKAAQGKKAQ